jgi:hypothetical protein
MQRSAEWTAHRAGPCGEPQTRFRAPRTHEESGAVSLKRGICFQPKSRFNRELRLTALQQLGRVFVQQADLRARPPYFLSRHSPQILCQ